MVALGLAGCGGDDDDGETGDSTAPEASTTGDSEVLRVAYQADIGTFDPDNGFEVAGLGAIRAVYEGLVEYGAGTTDLVGALAEEWTVSDDGLIYTFNLRDGATFHDGSPMTSAEVKAAFERRQSEQFILSYFLFNAAAMETPDPDTFVLTLAQPQPSLLDNLASAWGPKVVGPGALVDNAGEDQAASYLTENADGTGPYRLAEFSRGQQVVLERFDDYWGEAPHFATVEISIVPDIGQQVLQLQNGELDIVLHGYPFTQLESLPDGLAVEAYDDLGLEMAYVNTFGVLADLELREAVFTGLNPEGWVEDAFGQYGEPAESLYPQAMLQPDEPFTYPSDVEAARAIVDANGGLEIEIVYTAEEAAVQQRVADLLIAQLAEVGITATARSVPQDEVFTFIEDAANAPDLSLAQNNPDAAHPETQATLFFTTGAPINLFGYSNPPADELLFAAGAITDRAERDAQYVEGARILFEDRAFAPLADVKDVVVYREGLTNLGTIPAVPWNVDFGTISEG